MAVPMAIVPTAILMPVIPPAALSKEPRPAVREPVSLSPFPSLWLNADGMNATRKSSSVVIPAYFLNLFLLMSSPRIDP